SRPIALEIAMTRVQTLSVVHVTSDLAEKPIELRNTIRDCLRSGLDVVVICDETVCRRATRLALATSKRGDEFPNRRFAVVTPRVDEFVDTLPTAVVEHLTMFETEDQAIDWLGLGGSADSDRATLVWPMAV
ncbi:MAG: hypothetical protein SH850_05735, partial [Planctomycetaceae bacterium]|nr:hypothetical protein [Planctomycetaceae bacterium]